MTRQNPAFRIAIWGMTVGVILSLVGALTFFASGGRFLADTSPQKAPLAQVASAGDLDGLIESSGSREVPEPIEPAHDATTTPSASRRETASERRSEAIQKLDQELLALRGQISELSRAQLESQLTEIRHAEQLLAQHQTSREIASLEQEIATLKTQVATAAESVKVESTSTAVAQATPPATEESAVPPLQIVAADAPQRFHVDAQEVELTELLSALGQPMGWNVVAGPDVQGKVTCHWRNVEPEAALRQLLKVHGWQLRIEGEFALVEASSNEQYLPGPAPEQPTQTAELPEELRARAQSPTEPAAPGQEAEWQAAPPEAGEQEPAVPGVRLQPPIETDEAADSEAAREMPAETESNSTENNSTETPIEPAAPLENQEETKSEEETTPPITTEPASEQTSLNSQAPRILPALPATMTQVFRPRHVSSQKLLLHVRPLLTQNTGEVTASPPNSSNADILLVKDQPAVIAQVEELVRTLDVPAQSVQIEATVLQLRSTRPEDHGQFRKLIAVIDRGRCPQCGIVHGADEALVAGHIRGGWLELGGGLNCGVCSFSADRVSGQLQKQLPLSVTALAPVEVPDRQMAEIALTEQQGFRRQVTDAVSYKTTEVGPDGLQLKLRPSVQASGTVQLDLSTGPDNGTPQDTARIDLASDQCVVLGGLYFHHQMQITPASAGASEWHEVVVLIQARPVTPSTGH